MKKPYYPIALDLRGKAVLIAGGGQVAERKVKGFFGSGALVKVVSPELVPGLRKLAKSGKIAWMDRAVKASDIKGIDIVIAATSDPAVNERVSWWSRKEKALVNVVDRPKLSSFISPAVFRAPLGATVTVYTHGRDPVLSRDLKNFLKERWDEFLLYRNRLQKGPHRGAGSRI